MTSLTSAGTSLLTFDAVGPVQAMVVALVSAGTGAEVSASVVERSPLGPRAIRLFPGEELEPQTQSTPERLAQWLAGQPWVAGVSVRPRHVYVRVGTDALVSWVTGGLDAPRSGGPGQVPHMEVTVRLPAEVSPMSTLNQFRQSAVAGAVAALLEWSGFMVVTDTGNEEEDSVSTPSLRRPDCGFSGKGADEARKSRVVVAVGGESAPAGCVWADVAPVDVRQGALSARHGGSVVPGDLIEDILAWQATRTSEDRDGPAIGSAGAAEGVLGFSFLRTERARRVQLDDLRLHADSMAASAIRDARRVAHTRGAEPGPVGGASPSITGHRAVRDLAVELEMMPTTIGRATSGLDPAVMARYVRALADRAHGAAAHLPPGNPLWSVTGRAIDVGLRILGLADTEAEGPRAPPPAPLLSPNGKGR